MPEASEQTLDPSAEADRAQRAAIGGYLDALGKHRRRRGPQRAQIEARLARLSEQAHSGRDRNLSWNHALLQERHNLRAALAEMEMLPQPSEFEPAFIEHAAAYSERTGMTYAAWRRLGVPAGALNAAGVRPGAPTIR